MTEARKVLFYCTFAISVVLELWVRWFVKLQTGVTFFDIWPPIDNVMHFLWGLNICLIFLIYFKWKPRDALLGVLVWQMGWEAVEIAGDYVTSQTALMIDHFFFDGIKDTVMDFLGALLALAIVRKLPNGLEGLKSSPIARWMRIYLWSIIPLVIIGSIIYFSRMSLEWTERSPNMLAVAWIIGAAIITILYIYFTRAENKHANPF